MFGKGVKVMCFVFCDIDGVVVVDSVCWSKDLGFIVLGVGFWLLDSRFGD